MQEKLVSYLLGELSADESAALEVQLRDDPQLAAELERLRVCLDPTAAYESAEADDTSMPVGLADRTADSVEILACQLDGSYVDPPSKRCSFSMLDAAVAIGVVAAVGMMLVPALQESRESSRRATCQNNLKDIGFALRGYAADHAGFFPTPPPRLNAGSFAITVSNNGYIDREELAKRVVCPGSPEASKVACGKLSVRIPTFDELEAARGELLASLQRQMALNVAYRLPYKNKQGLRPIEDRGQYRQPLLSDAPTIVGGQWRSLNHGGYGVNVLYQDCSARYHIDFREPVRKDHFFVNADGRPAMPESPDDAVLVRSEYVPRVIRIPVRVKARLHLVPGPPEIGPMVPSIDR